MKTLKMPKNYRTMFDKAWRAEMAESTRDRLIREAATAEVDGEGFRKRMEEWDRQLAIEQVAKAMAVIFRPLPCFYSVERRPT